MYQPDPAHFAAAAQAGMLGLLAPAALTSLERTVIALARNEADRGRWTADAPRTGLRRRLAGLLRAMTGSRPLAGLADEKLEALRRFVALIRRRDRRACRAAETLASYGYRPDQLAAIEALARA